MTVSLRRLAWDDGPKVLGWRNSAEVAAYMYTDHAITETEHAAWLEGALKRSDQRYWIIRMDGASVGLANIGDINAATRRCDWAFYLAHPATRGRGVGAAVEYIVIRHVFEAMALNKLWCEVLLENESVWRLHASFGFVREACFRQHVWKAGRFQDVVGLGLLAGDWTSQRPACEARLAAKGFDLPSLDPAVAILND